MAEEAPNRGPEIRKDPIHRKWVIFSPARSKRPSDFKSKSSDPNPSAKPDECPFCIGHEHECAPEIFRVPQDSAAWKIRVIQNLYPALSRDLSTTTTAAESQQNPKSDDVVAIRGSGFHDVVIESPVHSVHLVDLSPVQLGNVLLAYKKRIQEIQSFDSIKYIQVFKNHGASAGASMSHSHSQIIALPIVPPLVSARLDGMKEYFEQTGKCSLCDIRVDGLLIDESSHFISVAPYASTWPFEIWIIPRTHSSDFHELDSNKAVDLGGLLKLMLQKISLQLNNPPLNFMIHTSALQMEPSHLSYVHWFIQIVPQLNVVGGFELGTGCHINPVFPEDAAKVLREVKMDSVDSACYSNLLDGACNIVNGILVGSPIQMIEPPPPVEWTPSSLPSPQVEPVTKKRLNNFSVEEDIVLISAWLNVSLDAVHDNEQRHKPYWQRMHEFFHAHKKFPSGRNPNSLTHRWSAIQLATKKFCECYAQVEAKQQSDKTELDKILEAKLLYQKYHKSSFQFEHCWNELRHQPKWIEDDRRKKLKKSNKSKDFIPDASSSASSSLNLNGGNSPEEALATMGIPPGRDVEKDRPGKRMRKASTIDDQDSPFAELLKTLTESKKRMQEDKMKYMELEQEERIMSVDLTKMSPIQVEYFKKRQLEIMQKKNWI